MCGIAGIFAYGSSAPPVDQPELLRIREAMIHRGPDGAGLWLSEDRRVGLAHRRLAIIDPGASGAQPMATFDGRLRITFNGEIYNFRELRKELEAKGIAFRSGSDTEVLLHLYADRGRDMVHSLRGMYAFALWDDYRKGVFLARDPFGIKPLYCADNGHTLRVASQVKALVGGRGIDCHPEAAGYVGFYLWGCVPDPYTLHREIRALPAGTCMWVDANGPRGPVAFFSVREEFLRAEAASKSAGSARDVDHVVGTLGASVRRHMTADVPVAAFLSAGLDSASMVALASRAGDTGLRALTLGFAEFRGSNDDETELAHLVAGGCGVRHETSWVTREDFESDLSGILGAMDQPSTDGVNTYLASKAAGRAGMKVVLSGLGGDELFGGYPSFGDVPRIRRFSSIAGRSQALRRLVRRATAPILGRFTSPKYAGLLEYGGSFAGAYLLRRSLFMPWELTQLMDPEFAARGLQELQTLPSLQASAEGLFQERSVVSALELGWYMRNQLLRDSDWAGMAHSVEIRVPYLDLDFVREVLRFNAGKTPISKIDIARRLTPPLPAALIARNKTGFVLPVREWCTHPSVGGLEGRGLRGWARFLLRKTQPAAGAIAVSGQRIT